MDKQTFTSKKRELLVRLAEQISEAQALFVALQNTTAIRQGPAAGLDGYTSPDHLTNLIFRRDYATALAFLYVRGVSEDIPGLT